MTTLLDIEWVSCVMNVLHTYIYTYYLYTWLRQRKSFFCDTKKYITIVMCLLGHIKLVTLIEISRPGKKVFVSCTMQGIKRLTTLEIHPAVNVCT